MREGRAVADTAERRTIVRELFASTEDHNSGGRRDDDGDAGDDDGSGSGDDDGGGDGGKTGREEAESAEARRRRLARALTTPDAREFVLRLTAPYPGVSEIPHRLYAFMTEGECRIATAFGERL